MGSSRWQQIERIYHAALELEENDRDAFVDEQCGGDSELRDEIESLLGYERRAKGFIGKTAVEIAAADIARDEAPSLIGREIGSFRILSGLGKGGMGEVWKARDTKLGREVAIKSLPEEFARDEERLARFEPGIAGTTSPTCESNSRACLPTRVKRVRALPRDSVAG